MSELPTTLYSFKLLLIKRYQDLEFVDECSDNLECIKCGDVALIPFLTSCLHLLCNECGKKLRQRIGTKCPKCNAPVTNVMERDKILEEKIKRVKMKCIEHKYGCEFEDELCSVMKHLEFCEKFKESRSAETENDKVETISDLREFRDEEFEFTGDIIDVDSNSDNENQSETDSDGSSSDDKIMESKQSSTVNGTEFNILLLGQTGHGKTTFVNAFANYLKFNDIESTLKSDLKVYVPCKITFYNDKYEAKNVVFGTQNDANENMDQSDQSCTQRCKKYEFNHENTLFRIFDTPGLGDTRGVDFDRINVEDILKVLSDYEDLHCICIFLKSNEARLVATFEYCIKQLLSQLPKSASNNIVFVFTHTRGTFYKPGDAVNPLQAILNNVKSRPPHVTIPFDKNNVFCLDNEAFRFILAMKKNIKFSENEKQDYSKSWEKSRIECKQLIKYLKEGVENNRIVPHKIKEILSVHHARRAISELSKPLWEIAVNIQDNLVTLNHQIEEIEKVKGNLKELEKWLYIPAIQLKIYELKKPQTVCGSKKCIQTYKVGAVTKYHYPQVCHNPCFLEDVPKGVTDAERLRYCAAMRRESQFCRKCKCYYSEHRHLYYKTRAFMVNEIDENVNKLMKINKKDLESYKQHVQYLKRKAAKYKIEEEKLTQYSAKFAIFLKQNAIVPYNDAFEGYLKQMVENEKFESEDKTSISGLEQMMENYKREKEVLEKTMSEDQKAENINAKEILRMIEELKKMKFVDQMFSFVGFNTRTQDGNADNVHNENQNEEVVENEENENDILKPKQESYIWKSILNWRWVNFFKGAQM